MTRRRRRRWWALGLLCLVQVLVALDLAIANIALPSIGRDLGITGADLQWVVSAYAIGLSGIVLLGGRAADLLGRRRMLLVGLALFGVGSLLSGSAWSPGMVVGARALQGVGVAILTPAALSLLTTTFPEGRERTMALGAWGAAGGLGGAVGMLLGGALTDVAGWHWAFRLELPIVAAAALLTPLLLEESRARAGRRFDVAGALLVAAGLSSALLAVSRGAQLGWTSVTTVLAATTAAALLAAFVVVERRAADPLVSLRALRLPAVRAANGAAVLVCATIAPMFLLLTVYMQRVLGFSPLQAGFAYLVIAASSIAGSTLAARLVARAGARATLVAGLGLLGAGLLWFSRLPTDGTYALDLLPGFVVVGSGMSLSFVAVNVAGLAGLDDRDAGFGSGLLGTSQQLGAALGVALLSAVALAGQSAEGHGSAATSALTAGVDTAFLAGAGIALLGIVVACLLPPAVGADDATAEGGLDDLLAPAA